jgi:hypothetical protein
MGSNADDREKCGETCKSNGPWVGHYSNLYNENLYNIGLKAFLTAQRSLIPVFFLLNNLKAGRKEPHFY